MTTNIRIFEYLTGLTNGDAEYYININIKLTTRDVFLII
jgi:hypothetical protein